MSRINPSRLEPYCILKVMPSTSNQCLPWPVLPCSYLHRKLTTLSTMAFCHSLTSFTLHLFLKSLFGNKISFDPPGSYGVGLWKNIWRGWSSFCSHTRFELGDGFKIRFWDDVWCGEMTLKEAFPVLYGIA
jgi:hypothetical protein